MLDDPIALTRALLAFQTAIRLCDRDQSTGSGYNGLDKCMMLA